MKIAIIGCGNLGTSLLDGWLSAGLKGEDFIITRRNVASLAHYESKGVTVSNDNHKAVEFADMVVFGLKPYNLIKELEVLDAGLSNEKVLVSLVSSISTVEISSVLTNDLPVVRVMPNTGAAVMESMTCICADVNGKSKLNDVETLFKHNGETIILEESLMDAATVLGASGVAFSLRYIRAMMQAGIQLGFSSEQSKLIASQVVKGASKLILETGHHPEYEIDKVSTPKGCTIEGLNEMEHNGFSSALIKGVVKSKQLFD